MENAMCYTRKEPMSEDRKASENRGTEMRTERSGRVDSLRGSDRRDKKPAPEHTPAKETVPAE